MKTIKVCQIYDSLAEKFVTTFLAPSDVFAYRQFKYFCDQSGTGSSDPNDFLLVFASDALLYEDHCFTDDSEKYPVHSLKYSEVCDETEC